MLRRTSSESLHTMVLFSLFGEGGGGIWILILDIHRLDLSIYKKIFSLNNTHTTTPHLPLSLIIAPIHAPHDSSLDFQPTKPEIPTVFQSIINLKFFLGRWGKGGGEGKREIRVRHGKKKQRENEGKEGRNETGGV